MRSKKVVVYIIVLAFMLLETVAAVSNRATPLLEPAADGSPKIYVKPAVYINPPTYFDITICVSGMDNLYGYEFSLAYNTTVLNCIGVLINTTGEGVSPQWNIDDTSGIVWVNVTFTTPAQPLNATSELAAVEINFQMPIKGRSPLDLYDTVLRDANGQPVAHTVEDGLVIPSVPGDVDLDGHVSLADVVCIAKAYYSKPGDPNWNPYADLNGDGKISLVDFVICALNYNKY